MTGQAWPEAWADLPVCARFRLPVPASSGVDPDTGLGRFGVNDPVAKLMCAAGRLCGICARPLDDALVFLTHDRGWDPDRYLPTDPAVHPDCATAAMGACPYIRRRLAGKPGWLWLETGSYTIEPGGALFVFRPGKPLAAVRRFAYGPAGLAEVAA